MAISDSLLILVGFVFAHAGWNLSDLPEGERLVPFLVVEKLDKRQLLRFEAQTLEQSNFEMNSVLERPEEDIDAWASAREGLHHESGNYFDVLTIEAKSKDMPVSVL